MLEFELWKTCQDTLVDADIAINSMMWQNAGRSGIDQWILGFLPGIFLYLHSFWNPCHFNPHKPSIGPENDALEHYFWGMASFQEAKLLNFRGVIIP